MKMEASPAADGWTGPARIALLVWVGLCALAAVLQEAAQPEPPPDRQATVAAVALAFGAIAGRMLAGSPVAGATLRRAAAGVHLLCLGAVGAVAVWLAAETGAVRTALGLCAGAAFLGLRRLRVGPPGAS